jgi:cellulose synthase/poly-beta-1,6-N-acetylglucosamine synthase-like glycosyltransferase
MTGERTWSVVICSYAEERWELLVRSIESALQQSRTPDEIVVVVDHNERLLEMVDSAFGDSTRVVENLSSPGESGSRNTGTYLAKGTHVAFLDDDACADADWLMHLDDAFDSPGVVGVGGALLPKWVEAAPRWIPEEFLWVVGCSYRGLPRKRAEIRNPIGANMAFETSGVVGAGGFDSRLGRVGKHPAACAETDLAMRIVSSTGGVIVYEPAAVAQHTVPAHRATWTYFRRRCFAEGRSKAMLVRATGFRSATSSERSYVAGALPRGILTRMADAVRDQESGPLVQCLAIGGLLAIAGGGFVLGLFTKGSGEINAVDMAAFNPDWVDQSNMQERAHQ